MNLEGRMWFLLCMHLLIYLFTISDFVSLSSVVGWLQSWHSWILCLDRPWAMTPFGICVITGLKPQLTKPHKQMIFSALHHEDQNKTLSPSLTNWSLQPDSDCLLILCEGYSVLWTTEMERGQRQHSAAQSCLTQSTFNLMCSHCSA